MLDEFDIFKDFLKHHELRWTPQRKVILEVFLKQKGHIPIEELNEKIEEKANDEMVKKSLEPWS